MAINPVSGPAYLLEGMRLIARPGLRRFVAIPLAINILVFAAALYWGISRFEGLIAWLHSLLPTLPDWLAWLDRGTVDGAAMGSASLATGLGAWLRKGQNGYVRSYGLILGVGVIVLAGVVILGQLG